MNTLRRIPGCDCDSDGVMQWFQCDKDNSSYEDNINFTQIEAADESNDECLLMLKHLSHLKKDFDGLKYDSNVILRSCL